MEEKTMKDKLVIEGQTYVKEGLQLTKQELEQFDYKTQKDLHKVFSRLFNWSNSIPSDEEILNNKEFGIADNPNVLMVIPRSIRAKVFIKHYIDADSNWKERPIPDIDFKPSEISRSKYSLDYFSDIVKILDILEETIDITFKKNSPCKIVSEDFKFLLAPRVED